MSKPQSYPFLAIAKRYGLDYGDVLAIAHYNRFGDARNGLNEDVFNKYPLLVIEDIALANMEFLNIQDGLIDWNTGDRFQHRDEWNNYSKRYGGTLRDFQAQGRALRPVPRSMTIIYWDEASDCPQWVLGPYIDCPRCGHLHKGECGEHPNGAPMYAADGTLLDSEGNRSIFDDVDDGDSYTCPVCDGGPGNNRACCCNDEEPD